MQQKLTGRARRQKRIRKKVHGTTERPRLCVFRSSKHIYAQVIDDTHGITIAQASSVAESAGGNKVEVAKSIGSAVAKACIGKGVEQVVFDRGGYRYHGRVRALAESAREAGLKF
ncbi:MAG: 50S ribosomal protein L18 [Myxococcales bacterium]|nr:50S ribosomal protein L18 [Myxococcales bacterium]